MINEAANIEWWLPLVGYIIGDIVECIYSKKNMGNILHK